MFKYTGEVCERGGRQREPHSEGTTPVIKHVRGTGADDPHRFTNTHDRPFSHVSRRTAIDIRAACETTPSVDTPRLLAHAVIMRTVM